MLNYHIITFFPSLNKHIHIMAISQLTQIQILEDHQQTIRITIIVSIFQEYVNLNY